MNEWRDDIKRVLRAAGGQGRDVVFLILDSQLQNDAFLQDIDSLLNSGLVPNIFTVEEKQEIIEVNYTVWVSHKFPSLRLKAGKNPSTEERERELKSVTKRMRNPRLQLNYSLMLNDNNDYN